MINVVTTVTLFAYTRCVMLVLDVSYLFLVCHLCFSPPIIFDRLHMKCYSLFVTDSLLVMFITISLS